MPPLPTGKPRDPLCDEIRRIRHTLGETQEKFRKLFGIARSLLVKWELYECPWQSWKRHWIKHKLAIAKRQIKMRRKRAEQKAATWRS